MSFVQSGYPRLSYSQLEQVWIQGGGSKAMAPLMAAIAMAESGGIAGNTNPTDNGGTQTSWGLWQISDGTHGWSYGGDPYDPVNNARVAVMKLHSQGLGAWGTYTSGAYKSFLRGNVPPGTGQIPTGSGGSGTGAGFTSTTFGNRAPTLGSFLPTVPIDPIVNPVGSIIGDIAGIGGSGGGPNFNPFDWVLGPIKSSGDALKAIGNSMKDIAMVFNGILWFMHPSNDLRVVSGLVGLIVLGIGIYLIATV